MSIHFQLGLPPDADWPTALAQAGELPAWAPFDARATAFVGRFSQRLLTHPGVRAFPELAALGHWFRAARLRELAQAHARAQSPHTVRRGRGLAFHVAPGNVDTVFLYSCLLSLLAGNVNWVRVSQKPSVQLDFLRGVLADTLAEDVGQPLQGRLVLLTYAHGTAEGTAISAALSQACMARVVWGGDATVAALRAIPLRPTALELCFADRFSAAALKADAVCQASPEALQQLAAHFCNDAFWFAQQACSSPRLISWVGTAANCQAARQRFWPAVQAHLHQRQSAAAFANTPAMSMSRLGSAFELAALSAVRRLPDAPLAAQPTRLQLQTPLSDALKARHGGNGLFLEQDLPSLPALAAQLSSKEQTLSVHGFARSELLALVDALPPRALDRIVPIGQALSFDAQWDGANLLDFFSRLISLPPDLA